MNSTNRGLNRFLILVVGLLLVAVGAVGIALGTVSAVATAWKQDAAMLARSAQDWVATPVVGTASLLVLGVIVVSAVLIVLLIVFIAKQGHGHTAAALMQGDATSSTRIDLTVPKALLEQHLSAREEIAGLRISAYEVRNTPMLKITARCRRGVSPAVVADLIARALSDLESIVGTEVPTFVQLTGGFRTGSESRALVA